MNLLMPLTVGSRVPRDRTIFSQRARGTRAPTEASAVLRLARAGQNLVSRLRLPLFTFTFAFTFASASAFAAGTDGSTFGLGFREMKLKGTPEACARAKKAYEKGHGPEAAIRNAQAWRKRKPFHEWEASPHVLYKKGDARVVFATNLVARVAGVKDAKAFRSAVLALPGLGEGETRWDNLRTASHFLLYAVKDDPPKIWQVKTLDDMIGELLWPEERVTCAVCFDAATPATADAALATGFFKGGTDDRFAPSHTYSTLYRRDEQKLLRTNPQPALRANESGRETLFKATCDAVGLHIYLYCATTNAWRAKFGLGKGAEFEVTVQPGEDADWFQAFFTAADPVDRNLIEWGEPKVGRKLTRDCVKTDSALREDCVAFHTVYPWSLFGANLPENGTAWRTVICGGADGAWLAFGGGASHELGRGARLVFALDDAEADRIREGAVREAVGSYRKVRWDWAEAGFWGDPHLGDADFYKSVVVPFVAELDAAAAKVEKREVTPSECRAFVANGRLLDWADFRLRLNAKRADWICRKLLSE